MPPMIILFSDATNDAAETINGAAAPSDGGGETGDPSVHPNATHGPQVGLSLIRVTLSSISCPFRPPALPPMVPMGHAGPSMAPAYIPPGMQQQRREEEPPSKRPRTEDSLIPEDMFLAKNRGPVTFTIVVPVVEDKPEWKLNGQMLSVTMPLTDTVSALKTKIMEEVGMPQGKQKLQHENIFFKVSRSSL